MHVLGNPLEIIAIALVDDAIRDRLAMRGRQLAEIRKGSVCPASTRTTAAPAH
jgi:hypothetical protein